MTKFAFEDRDIRVLFESSDPTAVLVVEELMERLLPVGDLETDSPIVDLQDDEYVFSDDLIDYNDYGSNDYGREPTDAELDAIEDEPLEEGDLVTLKGVVWRPNLENRVGWIEEVENFAYVIRFPGWTEGGYEPTDPELYWAHTSNVEKF